MVLHMLLIFLSLADFQLHLLQHKGQTIITFSICYVALQQMNVNVQCINHLIVASLECYVFNLYAFFKIS